MVEYGKLFITTALRIVIFILFLLFTYFTWINWGNWFYDLLFLFLAITFFWAVPFSQPKSQEGDTQQVSIVEGLKNAIIYSPILGVAFTILLYFAIIPILIPKMIDFLNSLF